MTQSATAAPVMRTTHVRCTPDHAFAVFTEQIGQWWPTEPHSMYGPDSTGPNFEDGKIVERASDGRSTIWGEVLTWEPPEKFSVTWQLGGADDKQTVVTVYFRPDGNGTRVDLEHVGWEVYGDEAEAMRTGYNNGWVEVVEAFAQKADASVNS